MNKSVKRERNIYLDIVKAFAIICVVFGHCIQCGSGDIVLNQTLFYEDIVFKVIYSFHMPLFMLISGYLFGYSVVRQSWTEIILNRIKTLIVPVLIWALIPFTYTMIQQINNNQEIGLLFVIKNYILISLGNLWFLWAIFWCSLIVTIVRRFFNDSKWVYLLGFALTFFVPDSLNLSLYKFMYMYFVLGYFYNKDNFQCRIRKIYLNNGALIVSGILFLVLLLFYNRNCYIYTTGYCILRSTPLKQLGIDLFRFMIGFAGCTFILLVFYKIFHLLKPINRALMYMGKNTLGIYIISTFMSIYVLNKVTGNLISINYIITIVEAFILILFSLSGTLLIKKNKLLNKLLLGGRD